MKFLSLALTIIFTLSLSFTAHSQEIRGTKPLKKSTTIQQGKNWILAIGINRYENWQDLRNAKNDAKSIVQVLKDYYGFDNIIDTLYDENASKTEIINAIEKAEDVLDPNDRLVVFFAGHGVSKEKITAGKTKTEGFLIPSNGEFETVQNPKRYIPQKEFLNLIADLPPRHICVFLDACNSGYAIEETRLRGSIPKYYEAEARASRKVFTSAGAEETASDGNLHSGNSVFTEQLINALECKTADIDTDNRISTRELINYLEHQMYEKGIDQNFRYSSFNYDDDGMMFFDISSDSPCDLISSNDAGNETYSALSFSSGTPEKGNLDKLSTYIPSSIIDALLENSEKEYEVEEVDVFSDDNPFGLNVPRNEYLSNTDITKYFDGNFIEIGNELIIQTYLRDAVSQKVLYEFPDIKGSSHPDSIKSIVNSVKRRVKGFLGLDEEILRQYTTAPDYKAYELLQQSYDVACQNIEEARSLADKAIAIDRNYFKAYLWKVWLNKKCPGKVDRINALIELEELENKLDRFTLSEYEENRMKIFKKEVLSDYDEAGKYYYLVAQRKNEYDYYLQAFWNNVASNHLSLSHNTITFVKDLEDFEDKDEILALWNCLYHFYSQKVTPEFKRDFELLGPSGFNKFGRVTYYFLCKLLLDTSSSDLFDKLNNPNISSPKWHKSIGNMLNRNGDWDAAEKFYQKSLDLCNDSTEISNKVHTLYKLGRYDDVVYNLEKVGLDSFLIKQDFNNVVYYLISSKELAKDIDYDKIEKRLLEEERFPGFAYYSLAKYELSQGKSEESMKLLKQAYKAGYSYGWQRYHFDPDFKPLFNHPEFMEFVKPK